MKSLKKPPAPMCKIAQLKQNSVFQYCNTKNERSGPTRDPKNFFTFSKIDRPLQESRKNDQPTFLKKSHLIPEKAPHRPVQF